MLRIKPSINLLRGNWSLTNPQRRFALWGTFYEKLFLLESRIPKQDGIRWVSPEPAWYAAYFLYPRLLRFGSAVMTDAEIDRVHRAYPNDWVVVYGTKDGKMILDALPPSHSI